MFKYLTRCAHGADTPHLTKKHRKYQAPKVLK